MGSPFPINLPVPLRAARMKMDKNMPAKKYSGKAVIKNWFV